MTEKGTDKVSIVVTGLAWMGQGTRSINSTLEEMLQSATDEIQIAAYILTEGAREFTELLSSCLRRGIKITLILNRFEKQPAKTRKILIDLLHQYNHFNLFEFNPETTNEDLHAKIIVVDRSKAVIGSSNLSWKGLILNHEIAAAISGPSAAKVGSLIDKLLRDKRTKLVSLT